MIDAVLVNYRSSDEVIGAVDSIRDDPLITSIFVIDNSESDAEWQVVAELAGERVVVQRSSKNIGFGAACNVGYRFGTAPFVLLLNPDARLCDGALARLVDTLGQDPGLGAVGPQTYWDDAKTVLLPPQSLPTPTTALLETLCYRHPAAIRILRERVRKRVEAVWRGDKPVRVSALSGGIMVVRRRAVEEIGGLFDERFFMFFEDMDLCVRLLRGGWRLTIEPRAIAVHHYRHSATKEVLMGRTGPLYWAKHWPDAWQLRLARWVAEKIPVRQPETPCDLGPLSAPFRIDLPDTWQRAWRLEISPLPHGMPFAGWKSRGPYCRLPDECWKLLTPGNYFGCLAPAEAGGNNLFFRWSVPPVPERSEPPPV